MSTEANIGANASQRPYALRLVICGISAAIAPHIAVEYIAAQPAIAQITPDDTLGAESSDITPNTVTPNAAIDSESAVLIEGGAIRENSLFHSFEQFNIGDNQRVYFANPTDISTIFSRVTGAEASSILGTLGVNGPADLFFINPNGILFGPNATLDVDGSLFMSTAESILFNEDVTFSATSSQTLPLLTVSAPTGLQYGSSPGAIDLQGPGHNLDVESIDPLGIRIIQDNRPPGLQVPSSETLALIGGDITLSGANITTEGGRLEVGSVGPQSLVNIESVGDRLLASYENVARFNSIELTNESAAVAAREGAVYLQGGRIFIDQDSVVFATDSASLNVSASENLRLLGFIADSSESVSFPTGILLQNDLNSTADAGALTVKTPQLSIENGAGLITQNFGTGSGGNIDVQAPQLQVKDSFIFAGAYSEGDSGSVNIQSQQLNIDRAFIGADTFDSGASGNITINADQIGIHNQTVIATDSFAEGRAGDITIQAQQVQLEDNVFVSAVGRSLGAGGSVNIKAQERLQITASGVLTETLSPNGGGTVDLFAPRIEITEGSVVSSANGGTGQGGNANLNTDSLQVVDSSIAADTLGQGAGGSVRVQAREIDVTRGRISALTALETGAGGNIVLEASERVTLSDRTQVNTESDVTSSGDGGDITIQTGVLLLQQGSQLVSRSSGFGDAGNVTIQATDQVVLKQPFIDSQETTEIPTAILALLEFQSVGEGGNIDITTGSLSVLDGAELLANTFGEGDAGNVNINASREVILDGVRRLSTVPGGIFSNVGPGGSGDAGQVNIQAERLSVLNGARIASSVEGTAAIPGRPAGMGKGGEINIEASDVLLFGTDATGDRISGLFTDTQAGAAGNGGRITVQADTLRVAGGAQINSQTENASDSGKVAIDTSLQLAVDSSGEITVSSRNTGSAGNLQIASQSVVLDNGEITAQTSSGNGGNITLLVDDTLLLRNGGELSSTAGSAGTGGDGGDIAIEAGFIAAIAQENSDITANAFNGQGGSISVNTQGVLGIQSRDQPTFRSDITASSQLGQNGVVVINTPEITPNPEETTLPADVLDTFNPPDQSLCSGNGNQFTFSRTGGVPASPYDTLNGAATWEDWYIAKERAFSREGFEEERLDSENLSQRRAPAESPLKEAQRWKIDANGNVIFLLDPTLSSAVDYDPSHRVSCQQLSDVLSQPSPSGEPPPEIEILS